MDKLIKQLDNDEPESRNKAQEELIQFGIKTLHYFSNNKLEKLSEEQKIRIKQIEEALSDYREFEKLGIHKNMSLIVKLIEITKEKDKLLQHLIKITGYKAEKEPTAKEILQWFEKNKEKLTWDEKLGKYLPIK